MVHLEKQFRRYVVGQPREGLARGPHPPLCLLSQLGETNPAAVLLPLYQPPTAFRSGEPAQVFPLERPALHLQRGRVTPKNWDRSKLTDAQKAEVVRGQLVPPAEPLVGFPAPRFSLLPPTWSALGALWPGGGRDFVRLSKTSQTPFSRYFLGVRWPSRAISSTLLHGSENRPFWGRSAAPMVDQFAQDPKPRPVESTHDTIITSLAPASHPPFPPPPPLLSPWYPMIWLAAPLLRALLPVSLTPLVLALSGRPPLPACRCAHARVRS
jgi:hypothetical protein